MFKIAGSRRGMGDFRTRQNERFHGPKMIISRNEGAVLALCSLSGPTGFYAALVRAGTFLPLRQTGIRPWQTSHSFLGLVSMPAFASTARLSARSRLVVSQPLEQNRKPLLSKSFRQ